MRKVRKFVGALALASFVASGMVAFSTPVYAAGPGGGNSQTRLCQLLARAYDTISSFPDSDLKTALLQAIADQQASLGCE